MTLRHDQRGPDVDQPLAMEIVRGVIEGRHAELRLAALDRSQRGVAAQRRTPPRP